MAAGRMARGGNYAHQDRERLIGTILREYLDHVIFCNALDIARELAEFRIVTTSTTFTARSKTSRLPSAQTIYLSYPLVLGRYSWRQHFCGLPQTPVPA
jgi:hypothetical protein